MEEQAMRPGALVRVWDPLVRIFHWSLVVSFAVAWLTSHSWETLHHLAGYAAALLIGIRLIWGLIGTRYARFASFVRHPRAIIDYLRAIVTGSEARHIGHNPAGGAMIVALILAMAATATTDTFWGVEWMQKLHDLIAHGLLLLVGIHVAGVVLASVRHRENLVLSMLSGLKRPPEPGDVE